MPVYNGFGGHEDLHAKHRHPGILLAGIQARVREGFTERLDLGDKNAGMTGSGSSPRCLFPKSMMRAGCPQNPL